ncbi:MAG: FAD-binding domain-containing protein [Candidatus Puniceispirillaceae bacterium]
MDLFARISADTPRELTRRDGLEALKAFLPLAGAHYAAKRNFDKGRGQHLSVSCLSAYVRRRLITETEILQAVQAHHNFSASEKFISEIFWRTYFKGWLEMRPSIWSQWLAEMPAGLNDSRYLHACSGKTDIACFNEWAEELRETGYLHNHARMWFASIWIFTLNLPWQWGAAFFMQWLRDGDPACNTLSWRWVAGLHSRGKHYLARAENIEKFTQNRFAPYGELNEDAISLMGAEPPPAIEPHWPEPPAKKRYLLVIHGEDCHPESWKLPGAPEAVIILPGWMGNLVLDSQNWLRDRGLDRLEDTALADTANRAKAHFDCPVHLIASEKEGAMYKRDIGMLARQISELASQHDVQNIITSYLPAGAWRQNFAMLAESLTPANIHIDQVVREYDRLCWPYAKRGFFPFKENIPRWLSDFL